MKAIAEVFFRWDIQRRALIISLTAGTILNCINQMPDVMDGELLHLPKLVLTYLVPYCVSTYSSTMAARNSRQ